ncbi:MAG: Crp/Fnr family transcriptional regulator [Pseudomonadota bacterium]
MNVVLTERIKCNDCPIRHRAICSSCDETELDTLEKVKYYKSFTAGSPIGYRGDSLGFVGSVVKGVATLEKTMEDGRTQTVGLLLPSDFLGRPGRSTLDYDVTASTDVTLCCFERGPFEDLVGSTPNISSRLIEMALDELDAARDWMLLLGRKTAEERVASFIEMIARRSHIENTDDQPIKLVLPLTRESIANYLGLTLETVSRQLSRLKSKGIIRFLDRRHFEVLDYQALHASSGDDADGGMIF